MSRIRTNRLYLEEADLPNTWLVKERKPDRAICESDRGHVREIFYSDIEGMIEDPDSMYDDAGNLTLSDEEILRALMADTKDDPELNKRYTGRTFKRKYTFDPSYLIDIEEYNRTEDDVELDTSATKLYFVGRDSRDPVIVEKDFNDMDRLWEESKKYQNLGLDGLS